MKRNLRIACCFVLLAMILCSCDQETVPEAPKTLAFILMPPNVSYIAPENMPELEAAISLTIDSGGVFFVEVSDSPGLYLSGRHGVELNPTVYPDTAKNKNALKKVQQIKLHSEQVVAYLSDLSNFIDGDAVGCDYLSALMEVQRLGDKYPSYSKTVYILGNGIPTSGVLNLQDFKLTPNSYES